jgi:hypothetical protein
MGSGWTVLARWSRRRWLVAAASAAAVAVLVALPTAVIPNPVFGRAVAETWWSYPVVVATGILGGLLFATYVREPGTPGRAPADDDMDRASKLGMAGAMVSFFAVGCPVCNKLVLLALGASGAVTWFAPLQPFLALVSIGLLVVALRVRIRNQYSCAIDTSNHTQPTEV